MNKNHPLYRTWKNIKQRCLNPKNTGYHNYGGRGIKMCQQWQSSFDVFVKDVGVRPSLGHSIDRHPDLNGNYEPGNVRWATRKEQANNKRTTHLIEFRGETLPLLDWARRMGLSTCALRYRLRQYGVEFALTTPPSRGRRFKSRLDEFAVGDRVGRLTVIGFGFAKDSNFRAVICKCDCGTEKTILPHLLISGDTKSCGCLQFELAPNCFNARQRRSA